MRETAGEPYNKEVRLPAVVVLKLCLRQGHGAVGWCLRSVLQSAVGLKPQQPNAALCCGILRHSQSTWE